MSAFTLQTSKRPLCTPTRHHNVLCTHWLTRIWHHNRNSTKRWKPAQHYNVHYAQRLTRPEHAEKFYSAQGWHVHHNIHSAQSETPVWHHVCFCLIISWLLCQINVLIQHFHSAQRFIPEWHHNLYSTQRLRRVRTVLFQQTDNVTVTATTCTVKSCVTNTILRVDSGVVLQ